MLEANYSEIEKCKDEFLQKICEEVEKYGDFMEWYNKHSDLRTRIKKKYIKFRSPFGTYRRLSNFDSHGKYIDHHILSYLIPMDYVRIGWGGQCLHDYEQITLLAKWFKVHGARFIYAPLPNKGMIYPEMIDVGEYDNCDIPNYPMQRYMIKQLLQQDVEVVDIFDRFYTEKEHEGFLYQEHDHNLSSCGATVVANAIAEYIRRTTTIEDDNRYQRFVHFRDKVTSGYDICHEKKLYMVYELYGDSGVMIPSWCENTESDIAIFGDCNLQADEEIGAGIAANLTYELKNSVYNAGRKLLFGANQSENMDVEALELLKTKKIIIYVAFASAGFVRTSSAYFWRLFKPLTWNTLDLDHFS